MRTLVDTNIVYYLSGISNNDNFNSTKFNKDIEYSQQQLSITYFTLFEILMKFDRKKDNKKLKSALNYLHNANFGFFYNLNSEIYYNHIF